jgi:hypothetical protein
MSHIQSIEKSELHVCAIHFDSNCGSVLIIVVCISTDEENDCLENHIAICARVSASIAEFHAAHRIIAGNFSCQFISIHYSIFENAG